MTAVDLFVSGVKQRGVEWIATLCGHGLDPLLQAARKAELRLVDVRNEQTAAYIADGYGRLTRRPGVCAVTSGIGLVNALSGVANAWFDRAPMLLISGAAATHTAGMGHFQELDQVTLARPITKYSRAIDCAERALEILDQALAQTVSDPPGPAHLMFPLDVQTTEVSEDSIVPCAPVHADSVARNDDLEQVAEALVSSEAPLIIAGSGVFYDDGGEELLRFCEDFQLPLVTPLWDRGPVSRPSSVFFGVIGAATGGPALLKDADCILMAGAEIDYRVGYLRPPAVRHDARIFRFRSQWSALAASSRAKGLKPPRTWLAECARRREEFHRSMEQHAQEQRGQALHALDIIRAIESVLDCDPVLLIDGGSIGQWAHQWLCARWYPGHWLTCGRSGVVGWGIGGAMAARLAFPKRPVILLAGDGAFTFNAGDLECAVRQDLPFVAIVADDCAWGVTRIGQIRQFGEATASSLGPIQFDRLAESLGARGVRASTPEGIAQELRRAIAEPVASVIHVPISGGNP
jgi:acetolactate synthase I/II/III large subunit